MCGPRVSRGEDRPRQRHGDVEHHRSHPAATLSSGARLSAGGRTLGSVGRHVGHPTMKTSSHVRRGTVFVLVALLSLYTSCASPRGKTPPPPAPLLLISLN